LVAGWRGVKVTLLGTRFLKEENTDENVIAEGHAVQKAMLKEKPSTRIREGSASTIVGIWILLVRIAKIPVSQNMSTNWGLGAPGSLVAPVVPMS